MDLDSAAFCLDYDGKEAPRFPSLKVSVSGGYVRYVSTYFVLGELFGKTRLKRLGSPLLLVSFLYLSLSLFLLPALFFFVSSLPSPRTGRSLSECEMVLQPLWNDVCSFKLSNLYGGRKWSNKFWAGSGAGRFMLYPNPEPTGSPRRNTRHGKVGEAISMRARLSPFTHPSTRKMRRWCSAAGGVVGRRGGRRCGGGQYSGARSWVPISMPPWKAGIGNRSLELEKKRGRPPYRRKNKGCGRQRYGKGRRSTSWIDC